jgi:tRNA (mo5U34)-methyltransferase
MNTARTAARSAIDELAPWFHNLHLPDGQQTAPQHELGDFPWVKWKRVADFVPRDLSGWTVLDIGCNAGFYSFELARRGAQVTGIDIDDRYLAQARWASKVFALEDRVQFKSGQVYELAQSSEVYDLVWFTGVFYHLRYPVLALDIVRALTGRMMMFQSLTMPGVVGRATPDDISLDDREHMLASTWPKMAYIEHRLADDPTNWWAPNQACLEALLRSAGFRILAKPAHEFYLCSSVHRPCEAEYDLVWKSLSRQDRD